MMWSVGRTTSSLTRSSIIIGWPVAGGVSLLPRSWGGGIVMNGWWCNDQGPTGMMSLGSDGGIRETAPVIRGRQVLGLAHIPRTRHSTPLPGALPPRPGRIADRLSAQFPRPPIQWPRPGPCALPGGGRAPAPPAIQPEGAQERRSRCNGIHCRRCQPKQETGSEAIDCRQSHRDQGQS